MLEMLPSVSIRVHPWFDSFSNSKPVRGVASPNPSSVLCERCFKKNPNHKAQKGHRGSWWEDSPLLCELCDLCGQIIPLNFRAVRGSSSILLACGKNAASKTLPLLWEDPLRGARCLKTAMDFALAGIQGSGMLRCYHGCGTPQDGFAWFPGYHRGDSV